MYQRNFGVTLIIVSEIKFTVCLHTILFTYKRFLIFCLHHKLLIHLFSRNYIISLISIEFGISQMYFDKLIRVL